MQVRCIRLADHRCPRHGVIVGVAPGGFRGFRASENGRVEPWQLREWYGDYLDALNRHDLDAIRLFLAPGVRRAHLPGGDDAWIADLAELFRGFPDWRWRRIQLVVEEDRIAAHLRGSGTHSGPFLGAAATRRRLNLAEFSMLRVAGGRIVEVTASVDNAGLLAELRS
jgi:predicted ester cyclase